MYFPAILAKLKSSAVQFHVQAINTRLKVPFPCLGQPVTQDVEVMKSGKTLLMIRRAFDRWMDSSYTSVSLSRQMRPAINDSPYHYLATTIAYSLGYWNYMKQTIQFDVWWKLHLTERNILMNNGNRWNMMPHMWHMLISTSSIWNDKINIFKQQITSLHATFNSARQLLVAVHISVGKYYPQYTRSSTPSREKTCYKCLSPFLSAPLIDYFKTTIFITMT